MKISMKLLSMALGSVLLVACSQDVRDIKMSQITQEQKEQALKQMKQEDLKWVKIYEGVDALIKFKTPVTAEQKKEFEEMTVDRSYNEMISFAKEKIEKEKAGK